MDPALFALDRCVCECAFHTILLVQQCRQRTHTLHPSTRVPYLFSHLHSDARRTVDLAPHGDNETTTKKENSLHEFAAVRLKLNNGEVVNRAVHLYLIGCAAAGSTTFNAMFILFTPFTRSLRPHQLNVSVPIFVVHWISHFKCDFLCSFRFAPFFFF